MLGRMRFGRALAGGLLILVGCNSVPPKPPKRSGDTIRYRLLLRDNPVSPRDAMHCYSGCQSARTPNEYVECLEACPGFEKTPGEYCSKSEVPPEAACLTVRKVPVKTELPPGMVVLAVIGQFALIVGMTSLCLNNSPTHCGSLVPPR